MNGGCRKPGGKHAKMSSSTEDARYSNFPSSTQLGHLKLFIKTFGNVFESLIIRQRLTVKIGARGLVP